MLLFSTAAGPEEAENIALTGDSLFQVDILRVLFSL